MMIVNVSESVWLVGESRSANGIGGFCERPDYDGDQEESVEQVDTECAAGKERRGDHSSNHHDHHHNCRHHGLIHNHHHRCTGEASVCAEGTCAFWEQI